MMGFEYFRVVSLMYVAAIAVACLAIGWLIGWFFF